MSKKSVQFSGDITVINTFSDDEYDRTPSEVAKLTYNDAYELLQLRCDFRKQMQLMMCAAQQAEECDASKSCVDTPTPTCA